MYLLSYIAYTFVILGVFLAILGFSFNRRSPVNRIFAVGMIMISLWTLGMAIIYQVDYTKNHTSLMLLILISSNLVNPLVVNFIFAMSRSKEMYYPWLQFSLWASVLVLIFIDFTGGSSIRGLRPTPWGNAFIIETGLRYYLQLSVMFFHFAVATIALTRGISRSISREYRRKLLILALLAPFLHTGVVAANFFAPVILGQPFPSIGVLFWGVVQIVIFASILGYNLLEDEAKVILQGVNYSRNRPVISYDKDQRITWMNDPARTLLKGFEFETEELYLNHIFRDGDSYSRVCKAITEEIPTSLTVTLTDGLSSITLLPESMRNSPVPGHAEVPTPDTKGDEKVIQAAKQYELSPREQDVLTLLLQGYSTGEIAEQLFISHNTAKSHISHIHAKVGTSSRPALLTLVLQGGK